MSHHLVEARDLVFRYPDGTKALDGLSPLPGIAALSIVVNEADAAGAMLDMARIPYADGHHGLVVGAKDAGGVIVELVED